MLLLGSRGTGFNSLRPDHTEQFNQPSGVFFYTLLTASANRPDMPLFGYGLNEAFEIPTAQIQTEYKNFFIKDEVVGKAFRLIRDLLIFTNKRLLVVDKQGLGTKIDYLSIPYKSIEMYSMQTAGLMEKDNQIVLWLKSHNEPRKFLFHRGSDINSVYNLISNCIL